MRPPFESHPRLWGTNYSAPNFASGKKNTMATGLTTTEPSSHSLSPFLEFMLLGVHQANGDVLVHEQKHRAHQGGEKGRPAGPNGQRHKGHQPRAAHRSG